MATYSREEFVRQVLVELAVLDATEAPEAEDAQFVGDRRDQKLEELYEEGLLPFDVDAEVPGRYFLPLIAIVALECATAYGKPLSEYAAKASEGMRRLWKLRQQPVPSIPTRATYY
jgi:hypothetical protein